MPDLRPVYDELCRRLSVHEDAFRVSANLTERHPDELDDLTVRGRDLYEAEGLLRP